MIHGLDTGFLVAAEVTEHVEHTGVLAILAVIDGQSVAQVALVLRVHEKTSATWGQMFCCYGLQGAPRHQPTGRPPKLPPSPKAPLPP